MSPNLSQVNQPNSSHQDFVSSQISVRVNAAAQDEMFENNITRVTLQSVQLTEGDDISLIASQKPRELKPSEKTKDTNIDEVKKVFESRLKVFASKEETDGMADQFTRQERNREYHLDPKVLSSLAYDDLGTTINEDTDPLQIIGIIQDRLSRGGSSINPGIINKSLDFLIETTRKQVNNPTISTSEKERLTQLLTKLEVTQDNYVETHAVSIQVTEKIIGAVDALIVGTGSSVKETIDHVSNIVHNPPDIPTLRKFYDENGGLKDLKNKFKILNTYINSNFKRKDLENGEIANLFGAARKMQAILHVGSSAAEQCNTTLKGYIAINHLVEAAA